MEYSYEDNLILSCAKIYPSSEELEKMNGLIPLVQDWDYFANTIIDRGSAPLFYKKLSLLNNSSVIPSHIKAKLQQTYYITFSRSSLLYERFRSIAKLFTLSNIPFVALKGIYLSEWLYQDIGLRQMSDIDLLVHKKDADKCLSILAAFGFKPASVKINLSDFVENQMGMVHYPAMILDGVSIEIHIKLHRKSEKYNLKLDEIWKNAIPVTIYNAPALTLNDTDLLIYLCLHLDKHFKNGHVQFTCFNDITNLLDKYAETIIWEDFVKSCVSYKCENIVFKYFVLVNKYMNASLPTEIVQKYNSYLTNNDEQLFLKYLNGFQGIASGVSGHLVSIKKLNTITLKIKYVLDIIFPSRKFMMEKYLNQFIIHNSQFIIKEKENQFIIHNSQTCPTTVGFINEKKEDQFINKKKKLDIKKLCIMNSKLCIKFWWLWYPYRWWVGVKGVFKLIRTPNPLRGIRKKARSD